MLFDLKSGKRRRVVQVVFGFLAFVFAISFVGFGIGSDVSGGIFDVFSDDSGDSADLSSQYDPQIEQAEKQLQQDPKDEQALIDLARFRYLAGTTQLEVDEETQAATLTEETRAEWNMALDAWERYQKTDPKNVDPQVAAQMICAYVPLLPPPQCVGAQTDDIDFGGAVETQKLLVADDPNAPNYVNLAYLLYNDGQLDAARDAADQAIAKAPSKEKARYEKAFDKLDKQAVKIKKVQEKAGEAGSATGESQLQNPFGTLGSGSGTGVPPSTP
jgi:tetratricopeptide (TPR) repeat protein